MARSKGPYARCKWCDARSFAWGHPSGRSTWALYEAQTDATGAPVLDASGRALPDKDKPHRCAKRPTTTAPVQDTPQAPAPVEPDELTTDEQNDEQDTPETPQADPLAQAIARAVAPLVHGKVDAAAVRKIAAEVAAQAIAEAVIPRKVETIIKVERPDGTTDTRKGEHTLFPLLLSMSAARVHTYLWGAPGGGKSTAAAHVAEALGLRYGYISLNPQTPDSKLLGYMDATGNYRRTVFRDCYERGGVFCIDEQDNCSDSLLTTLNGALENGHGAFPDGVVERHPDFVCVSTGNTAGRGGSQNHAGRRPFDAATSERFVFIEWTYDETLEEQLTLAANPDAGAWLAWVRNVRAFAKVHHPRLVASPRASIRGAQLLKAGSYGTDVAALAEAVLFKGLDRDSVAAILRAHPLPKVEVAK